MWSEKRHQEALTPERACLVELQSEIDFRRVGEVLRALRPNLELDIFIARRSSLIADGYHLVGVEVGSQLAAVASYTISPHATLGRELLIHDMVTRPSSERRGYARLLLQHMEQIARQNDCGRIFVHTREAAQFYERCGFSCHSQGLTLSLQ